MLRRRMGSSDGPRMRLVLCLAALALVAVACGSQRSTDDFAAVYAGFQGDDVASEPGQTPGTTAPTAQDPGGDSGPAQDTGSEGATSGATTPAGQDQQSAGEGTAQPGAGAEQGSRGGSASGEPIRIASVGTTSGPVGAAIGAGVPAVQAWAAHVNANGGIGGRPIEVLTADDGGDPSRHRAIVQEMVERRGVIAFVYNPAALSGQSAVDYLERERVPVIGSEGGNPWFHTSPMMFAQMATDHVLADSFAKQIAAMTDLRKIAIFPCAEIQSCTTATRAEAFEAQGFDVVMHQPASLASTSYASQCQSAQNRGAEIMLLGMDGQSVMRFADNCSSIGFEPLWGIVGQAVIDAHLEKPNLDGAVVATPVAPWFEDRVPGVGEFIQAMSTYAPAAPRNGAAMQGWVAAKLFEAAVRGADDPTTSEGVLNGLYGLNGNDLGGLTYPMTFSPDDENHSHRNQPCWYAAEIQSGQFVSRDGGKRHC